MARARRPEGAWVLLDARNTEKPGSQRRLRLYLWPRGAGEPVKVAWAGPANEAGTRGRGTGLPSKVYDEALYEQFLAENGGPDAPAIARRWLCWIAGGSGV